MSAKSFDLASFIRAIPDFPKPGIIFRDITPLLGSAEAFDETVRRMAGVLRQQQISKVAAIESRGFIFGACVARELGCGLVPIRKPGKLPWTTHRHEYELEYGTDALEMHLDAVVAQERVAVVDDVLATGGTASAAAALIRHFGAAVVAFSCVIELDLLNGRSRLGEIPVHSLIRFA
jgi:adenine phosphoribosyltransferase